MKLPIAGVDFETKPIGSRPDYPPSPVGLALRYGRRREYLAWGHPTDNNCTRVEAGRRLRSVLRDHIPVFHHAEFDMEVMQAAFGFMPKGEIHCTMRSAFINEPRSLDLGLKPQAAKFLDWPADEQQRLKRWIIENVPEARKRAKKNKKTGELSLSSWGDYIHLAPGKRVGVYAIGDVDRTVALHHWFAEERAACDAKYEDSRMEESYQRELALIPIKMRMEQRGIRLRVAKLKKELPAYEKLFKELDRKIRKKLKVGDSFNVGSGQQLGPRLAELGLMTKIVRTKTGKVSTKRQLLTDNCSDKKLAEMLAMRGTLQKYISDFMVKWLDLAERNDGYIQPTFNTVRKADEFGGDSSYGARTGRLSSSDPNFQNIPSNAEDSPHKDTLMALKKALVSYHVDFIGLRDYFAPDEGHVWLRRDYDQQELRILAHREGGPFLQMYADNPRLDAHNAVKALVLATTGVEYTRKHIKQTNFGILYGMGLMKLAIRLGLSVEEATALRDAVLDAIPGIKALTKYYKRLARRDEPFFTWGGRRYYCEDPIPREILDEAGQVIGKRWQTFEYKMLNTDIQGSAADCTKVGMIQVDQNIRHSRIVLQVHDELLLSCPKQHAKPEMRRFREAMEDVSFKLPMLSSGETGGVSWARMKKVEW